MNIKRDNWCSEIEDVDTLFLDELNLGDVLDPFESQKYPGFLHLLKEQLGILEFESRIKSHYCRFKLPLKTNELHGFAVLVMMFKHSP